MSCVHGDVLQRLALGCGDHLAHHQRRAGGRIDLVPVMRFDDLDVVAFGKTFCRHLQQLHRDVDTDAHVGREDDRRLLRGGGDRCLAGVVETGGADDHLDAVLRTIRQQLQGAFGPGEIDDEGGVGQCDVEFGSNRHAGRLAEESAGIDADAGSTGHIERTGQARIGRLTDRLDQHLAHPAGSAGDCDLQCIHVLISGRARTALLPAASTLAVPSVPAQRRRCVPGILFRSAGRRLRNWRPGCP